MDSTVTYIDLGDPVYDEIEAAVRKTYKNSCIVWIEKVENKGLEDEYNQYKSTINPSHERRLFHGTTEDVSRIIIAGGFDPSLNKTCAYGRGVYFSTRAEYSKHYARRKHKDDFAFMMVCDVVCGKTGQGVGGKHMPKGFDSVTDNLKRPDMYIVNKREAAIPRYLVAFYPDAT